jgi:anti-sigma regulatory factor (Ser/Thr protein kinase)
MLTDNGLVHDVYQAERPWLALARLPLPHAPEAASSARGHTRAVLAARRVESDLAATVELAVSELVTNAVRHGVCPCGCTRGAVSLALLGSGDRLRVEVGDPSRTPPRWPTGIESVDAESTEGRGLLLVTGLATDWGDHPRQRLGKVVWCEFAPAARTAGFAAPPSVAEAVEPPQSHAPEPLEPPQSNRSEPGEPPQPHRSESVGRCGCRAP